MARAKALISSDPLRRWTAADALDVYSIPRWGCGYFAVNDAGNLIVQPRGEGNGEIDMKELIDELAARGIQLPILLRFSDILRARIELLCGAFNGAIKEYGYAGMYRGVYPIKVNQNRTVVEEIIEYGRPFHYGLAFAMRYGADIYALRIGHVIEPHEYDRFPGLMADPMSRKRNAWSYIDARDLGQIVHLCLEKDGMGYQVFNAVNDTITAREDTEGFLKRWCPRTPHRRALKGQ